MFRIAGRDQLCIDEGDDRRGVLLEPKLHALELRLGEEEIDQLLQQSIELDRLAIELDPAGVAEEILEDFS